MEGKFRTFDLLELTGIDQLTPANSYLDIFGTVRVTFAGI
jgi:hypothetical protein